MKNFSLAVLAIFLLLTSCEKQVDTKKVLDVPFTPQAPDGNWSEPWQNACEETSILMVDNFYQNENLDIEEEKARILEILKTKKDTIKISKDESLETISDLINSLELNWTTSIKKNPSVDELIQELADKRPVIIPVSAQKLPNPYYDDVEYHVIVLVGYDTVKKTFKVNDPGTQYGEDLAYDYNTLMNAINDLTGEKQVLFTKEK